VFSESVQRGFRPAVACLFVLLAMLLVAAPAQAELLFNRDFASDLNGWDNEFDRPAEWSSRDANGASDSGSAQIGSVGTSNGGILLALSQCHQVSAGAEYFFGGSLLVPEGQPAGTSAQIFVSVHAGASCQGEALELTNVGSTSVESWQSVEESLVTSSGAGSLRFALGVLRPGGETLDAEVLFDDLTLRRAGGSGTIDERLSGAWFNADTPGQGFFFDVSPEIEFFFAGWFTWTDTPGEYDWTTLQGTYSGNTAVVSIFRTSGGRFNDPTEVTNEPIGVAEVTFFDCISGQVSADFLDSQEVLVIPISRLTPKFPGC